MSEASASSCALFSLPWTAFNARNGDVHVDSPYPAHQGLSSRLHVIEMEGYTPAPLWFTERNDNELPPDPTNK